MRDNKWLASLLQELHAQHFQDIAIPNLIMVRFGRASRTRFGSIISRAHKGHSLPVTTITINALFRDESVPEYVISATLLHEFTHYAHGFHSPHKQLFEYPHKGNVVNREIRSRGGSELLALQEKWIKHSYKPYLLGKKLI